MKDKIFFVPPIREAWMTKAMFKWINRWVTASINIENLNEENINFLKNCLLQEHILALSLAKILSFNLKEIWFFWTQSDIVFEY